MQLRLTYEGLLMASSNNKTRARHKHAIRKVLHPQLRRFWETEPYLRSALYSNRHQNPPLREMRKPLLEYLREKYTMFGYEFVPLVTDDLRLYCSVEVLFLRPEEPGRALQSGDLDGRLKTLFDALRMPNRKDELGGYDVPEDDEIPFYCLMTDDKLVTRVLVETDRLLSPTSPSSGDNDSRLMITVRLQPYDPGWDNISFM